MDVLIYLLIAGLIFGLIYWLAGMLPAPAGKIVRVVVVVIAIVWLLMRLGGWGPVGGGPLIR